MRSLFLLLGVFVIDNYRTVKLAATLCAAV